MVKFSHPYMSTRKTMALTTWSFVGKVVFLLSNVLPRFVTAILPSHCGCSHCPRWFWEPKKMKSDTVFTFLKFKSAFSLSSLTFIKKLFSSSSLSSIKVVLSAYLRLLIFHVVILIAACESSSPAFHIIYSAYKLNKQGDNIQNWHTLFPILTHCSMSSYNCCFLTCIPVFQDIGNVVCYSHLSNNITKFVVIHTVKGFSRSQWSRSWYIFGIPLLFLWSSIWWQFDLLFLCLF